MIDESLLTRLYGRREDGWLPYLVFGGPKYTIIHAPGLHGLETPISKWTGYPMHGYRGLLVQDYSKPVTDQQVKLCWGAIDVDAEDNGDQKDLVGRVSDILFNQALIRASKSGIGAHCMFILHKPLLTDYATAGVYAKRIVAEPIKQLQAAGITKCVSGLPNLWLWSEGGKQRTVSDTGCTVGLPEGVDAIPGYRPIGESTYLIPMGQFTGLAARVLDRLIERAHGCYPRKINVNIGNCKRALEGLVNIKTKSKCRPEHAHEVNGFIELTDAGELRLISNADDNQCILYLASF